MRSSPDSWLHGQGALLMGVVHLAPLPGSPRYSGEGMVSIVDTAVRDAERIMTAGFDGFVIENFGDAPFFKDTVPGHTLAAMTRIAVELRARWSDSAILGANVLRNDAASALCIAAAAELEFIRVNVHVGASLTDQGVVEGKAAHTLRLRSAIAPNVRILADVDVKHARPLAPGYDRAEAARETLFRGGADGLIVSGSATGAPVHERELTEVAQAVPGAPVWVGSGADVASVASLLEIATGVIVGTAIKEDAQVTAPVSLERARAFVQAAR